MSNLQILSKSIRTFENLYSLNDLHKVGGNQAKHQPSLFIRLDSTQDLVSEIQKEDPSIMPIKSFNGGINRGTYACKELVIAYAAWISPAFHLTVLRAFLNQAEQQPKQLALPAPEQTFTLNWTESELKRLASFWCAAFEMHDMLKRLEPTLQTLGSKYHPTVFSQVREYQSTLDLMHYRLQRDIDHLQYSDPHDRHWQYCLETINNHKPIKLRTALR